MSQAVVAPGVDTQAPARIFSRESSGLVRVGSPWRMLALNVANIGVVYIMFTYWAHPAVFPQSNLLIAIPVAAAMALLFNLLYGMFSVIMPRTGSEYVFLSRALHPAIGFMASFAAATSQSFWVGIGGYWISQFVLGPLFTAYGAVSGNETIASIGAWASDPQTHFIFGTLFVVLVAALNIRGLRAYLRFQDINWIIGALTGVLLIVLFLLASASAFQAGFDRYAAAVGIPSYQGTLDLAAESGMPTGFSLGDTLGIIPIIWLIAWASTYMGGEVRTPAKTQLRATVGGMLLYAGIAFVLFFAISRPVSVEFNQALAWLSYNYGGDQVIEAYPVFMLYAGVLIDNLVLFLLVGAGLVLWSYLWIPSAMLIATRAMFAWSFDRIAPEKLSEVHPRYNSPWVAVLVVAVIGELFLILYHLGVFQFLTPALAYYGVFWLVSLCGVLFPYLPRTRPLLEGSAVDWRIAGIPVMAICGIAGLVFFSIGLYLMLTNDLLFLNSPSQLLTTALQFVVPLVLFFVARWYRQREGLPIDAAFREICRVTSGDELTIFYVADIHGSDVCFRKWLNAARFYGANVLIIGGDLTGKVLLPIYVSAARGGTAWSATWKGRQVRLDTQREVDELVKVARDEGAYGFVTTPDEIEEIRTSAEAERAVFTRLKVEALEGWIRLADERLADGGVRALVMAGNDDPPEIDPVLAHARRLEDVQGRIVELATGIWMASRGESTPTPWRTPRELPDAILGERVRQLTDGMPPGGTSIWNLHMPPRATGIDEAPELDADLRVRYDGSGEPRMLPVGSATIRQLIEDRGPTIALHGHIHEGRGRYRLGRTLGANPGSQYQDGVLMGVLLRVSAKQGLRDLAFTAG